MRTRTIAIELLGRDARRGTAMGYGTRLRSPKAIVAFSEEGATGKSSTSSCFARCRTRRRSRACRRASLATRKYAFRLIGKV